MCFRSWGVKERLICWMLGKVGQKFTYVALLEKPTPMCIPPLKESSAFFAALSFRFVLQILICVNIHLIRNVTINYKNVHGNSY